MHQPVGLIIWISNLLRLLKIIPEARRVHQIRYLPFFRTTFFLMKWWWCIIVLDQYAVSDFRARLLKHLNCEINCECLYCWLFLWYCLVFLVNANMCIFLKYFISVRELIIKRKNRMVEVQLTGFNPPNVFVYPMTWMSIGVYRDLWEREKKTEKKTWTNTIYTYWRHIGGFHSVLRTPLISKIRIYEEVIKRHK